MRRATILVILAVCFQILPCSASAPSAPPRKSPTANVGHGPKRGNIPNVGHGPKKGNTADTGLPPVEGNTAIPGAIPKIIRHDKGCEHRLVVGTDTLFAFDKYDLNPQAEETLNELGPMVKSFGKHPVIIEGHTDAIGTDSYNQTLSDHRARTVMDWLKTHGFIPGTASMVGYGKKRPVAPNTKPDGTDNPEGRQLNRRVELVVDSCK